VAGISGGWLRTQFHVDPPTPLHQIDPSHATAEAADPTRGAWQGPPILQDDPAPQLLGESVPFVVDTDGLVLEFSDWGDHEDGYGSENFREWDQLPTDAAPPGDVAQGTASALAHSVDRGAALKHVYDPGPFIDATDHETLTRVEGFGPIELPALSGGGQRGLNSYAVNNPALESYEGRGFRFGFAEIGSNLRRMYDPTRVNDERLVTTNTMTAIDDQPVPADPGEYNSPFTSLARIITNVNQRPLLRRQPPPIDQSIMTDGTEDLYDATSEWVIG